MSDEAVYHLNVERVRGEITAVSCGHCESDQIAEEDRVLEWRPVTVTNAGVMIGMDDNPTPESQGLICMSCTEHLSLYEKDSDFWDLVEYW
jgi:hypothetical protein